jgi:hypothetical protein
MTMVYVARLVNNCDVKEVRFSNDSMATAHVHAALSGSNGKNLYGTVQILTHKGELVSEHGVL